MIKEKTSQPITDYNDTDYEQGFWGEREYENIIEKHNIDLLLEPSYNNFIDIGGGFGRLIPTYKDKIKKKMVLFDYSQKLLDSAREKNSAEEKLEIKQGSFYEIPYKASNFDGAISVRVIHHVENVDKYLSEISRVLSKGALFILEYANKRNFLEIVRFYLHKSKLHPFDLTPENRSDKGLTYNFHPLYIKEMLEKNGFVIEKQVSSSLLRSTFLKKKIGQARLAEIEKKLPDWLKKYAISPSIFLKIRKA